MADYLRTYPPPTLIWQAGKHTSFVFSAESEEERQRWMRAVRSEVQGTRWREMRGQGDKSSDV